MEEQLEHLRGVVDSLMGRVEQLERDAREAVSERHRLERLMPVQTRHAVEAPQPQG